MTFRSTTAAPQRAATSQRIDVARELLLTPFGLDEVSNNARATSMRWLVAARWGAAVGEREVMRAF